MRFVRIRDRQLSLWQSTVAETARKRLSRAKAPASPLAVFSDPMVDAVTDHVRGVVEGDAPMRVGAAVDETRALNVQLSQLGFELGNALAEGDEARAEALRAKFRKYSDKDPGFLTCATTYAAYYAEYKGVFCYRDWQKQGGGDINYGVIKYKLPNDAKVGVIGDWGTGLDDARELLRSLMTTHRPAALIHLGDIYYSGTPDECQRNFAKIITEVFDDVLGKGKRIPVFTIPGNHDYYALGYGYYEMFNGLNNVPGLTDAVQPASYFCLRSMDDGWQFLAMDSGYYDSNPANQVNPLYAGPWLEPSEEAWHRDKMRTFKGATILLSHHQVFSANARLNGRTSDYRDLPYLNPFLYSAFMPYLQDRVAGWLWGHEHNLVLYKNDLFGVAKGRLVGSSAYEELESADPYKVNYPEVPYLDPKKYRLGVESGYYNHGYAVIDLAGREKPTDPVTISYYEFPSWGDVAPPSPKSTLLHSEKLARPTDQPHPVVTYGSPINLFAQEGLYVGPLYQQIEYFPTLSPTQHVTLRIAGGSGNLKDGDTVLIETTEKAAGKYCQLGAWSTPTLYYYSPGYEQEKWTVRKRDTSSGPEVRYGDEVYFVNHHYKDQWLMPYWSKVYGGIYLTTRPNANYYWAIRQPLAVDSGPGARVGRRELAPAIPLEIAGRA